MEMETWEEAVKRLSENAGGSSVAVFENCLAALDTCLHPNERVYAYVRSVDCFFDGMEPYRTKYSGPSLVRDGGEGIWRLLGKRAANARSKYRFWVPYEVSNEFCFSHHDCLADAELSRACGLASTREA